ncbi:hypothetical protein AD944_03315 [Acetobacter tropicalis]|uniref:Uncharacterized protein n=2 Tax=Acetobacter tropicalis TaxID=104102 RepID=A0A251ZZX0_9PROT|nr:hypothetical protein AD944_03315 [Acetobacter tropicalis]OUI80364.1 hypothetical protein HC62_17820 [Acetobacter tropicalis]
MQQNDYQQSNNTDNSSCPDDVMHRSPLLLRAVLHISTSSFFHASHKTLACIRPRYSGPESSGYKPTFRASALDRLTELHSCHLPDPDWAI